MPATAQALSSRVGLSYRPDLLTGTGSEAKSYQDRITDAAVREAWNYGKGDPALAARYYFGGSNRALWGPKTQAYASSILERLR